MTLIIFVILILSLRVIDRPHTDWSSVPRWVIFFVVLLRVAWLTGCGYEIYRVRWHK